MDCGWRDAGGARFCARLGEDRARAGGVRFSRAWREYAAGGEELRLSHGLAGGGGGLHAGLADAEPADEERRDRLDLWEKYHGKIEKSLTSLQAGQFLQIENQLALFVDITIAGEMPLVGEKIK